MKRVAFAFLSLVVLPIGSAIGCNAILGNAPGLLAGDGGLFDSSDQTEASPCGAGNKLCANTCLSVSDPANGCSGDCTACTSPTNGQPACNGPNGSCGLGSCNTGFADCDKNASDGCESLLTTKTACGSCDNDCTKQGKAFCSPDNSGGLQCSDTCNGTDCCGNQACSDPNDPAGDCVDLQNNLQRCGSCGNACQNVANATISCTNGQCGYKCNSGYQDCGNGVCAVLSGSSCGCSKENCNALSNGMWTCSSSGTCQCGDPATCSRGSLTACCGGGICCGPSGTGGTTATCTAENDNACGSSCATCSGGAHCDTAVHQCTCSTGGSACTSGTTTTCCSSSDYCDAGTCVPQSGGSCPSATSCSLDGGASGCCKNSDVCQTPNNSVQGCGSSCADCSGMGQCCCPSADVTGWSCAAKIGIEGGMTCGPGCNP